MSTHRKSAAEKTIRYIIDYVIPIPVFIALIVLVLLWIDQNPADAAEDMPYNPGSVAVIEDAIGADANNEAAPLPDEGFARHEIDSDAAGNEIMEIDAVLGGLKIEADETTAPAIHAEPDTTSVNRLFARYVRSLMHYLA